MATGERLWRVHVLSIGEREATVQAVILQVVEIASTIGTVCETELCSWIFYWQTRVVFLRSYALCRSVPRTAATAGR